jgi:hypothetical protein
MVSSRRTSEVGDDEQGDTHRVIKELRDRCARMEAREGEMVREIERMEAEGYQWEGMMEEVRGQLAGRNAEILMLQ